MGDNDDKIWDALLDARVVIWFCPYQRDADHPKKDSVKWETVEGLNVPECLHCGTKGMPR